MPEREGLRAWAQRIEDGISDLGEEANQYLDSYFARCTTDISRENLALGDVAGATITLDVEDGDVLLVFASMSATHGTIGVGIIAQLAVDGVFSTGSGVRSLDNQGGGRPVHVFRRLTGLSAGSHTIKLTWATTFVGGGAATCSCATNPLHHAALLIKRVRA